MHEIPETRYAKSGEYHIAYQVVGSGPIDLVFIPGFISNVEHGWDYPPIAHFFRRLASFARVIIFDKRGTGMSDPVPVRQLPTLEERMDDVRAVMDAAGSERAALVGVSEGGPMSVLFAATYPERTVAMVLVATFARVAWAPDYPLGTRPDVWDALLARMEEGWGKGVLLELLRAVARPRSGGTPVVGTLPAPGFQSRGGGGGDAHGLRDRHALDPVRGPGADAGPAPEQGPPRAGRAATLPGRPHSGRQVRRAARHGPLLLHRRRRRLSRPDRGVPHRRAARRHAGSRPRDDPVRRHRRLDRARRAARRLALARSSSMRSTASPGASSSAFAGARSIPRATASSPPSTVRRARSVAPRRSAKAPARWASSCGPACTPASAK